MWCVRLRPAAGAQALAQDTATTGIRAWAGQAAMAGGTIIAGGTITAGDTVTAGAGTIAGAATIAGEFIIAGEAITAGEPSPPEKALSSGSQDSRETRPGGRIHLQPPVDGWCGGHHRTTVSLK